MPSHDLTCQVAGAVRVGIVALGFVAFTGPAVMILSSPEAYAQDGEKSAGKSGDDKGGARVGAKAADRKAATGTSGGVRIFRGLVGSDGAGVSIHRIPTNAGAASSPARANAAGTGSVRTSQGTGAGPKAAFATAPATALTTGVGIGNHPVTVGSTGTAVGFGGDSFASGSVGVGFGGSDGRTDGSSTISGQGGTGGSDIPSAFETLSRAQQERVMQRCKEVVARPALAEQNQLTICQVLLAMARP